MMAAERYILIICLFVSNSFAQNKMQDWSLIYEDYFQDFDKSYWKKAAHTFESNLAQFTPANIFAEDGVLHLCLTKKPLKEKQLSGAELRSKHSLKYGKYTARLKPASGNGIVSGFFLYDTRGRNHEEIDIEFTGRDTTTIHFNHWVNGKGHHHNVPLDFDASGSFHEYSIVWTPDYICWEIDNREVYRTMVDIPERKMKLMFNIWASKSNGWAGRFNPQDLPADFKIDYIKIYSRNE